MAMTKEVIYKISSTVDCPLVLDTSHIDVMLGHVKKYGAMFILLPLLDAGIPRDYAQKTEVLENIYEKGCGRYSKSCRKVIKIMKNIIKKLPIWCLIVWPYVFFLGILIPNTSFLGAYCVLTIALCVLNIINACSYIGENSAKELSLWGMVIKLVHMPFYVAVMLLSIMIIMSVTANTSVAGIPPIVLVLIIGAFLFMITSSLYCAKGALEGKEQEIIKKDKAMMLSICSFIFVSDVICAVIIYSIIKKTKK